MSERSDAVVEAVVVVVVVVEAAVAAAMRDFAVTVGCLLEVRGEPDPEFRALLDRVAGGELTAEQALEIERARMRRGGS